jgi:histidinol dehydrogenase
MARTYLKSRMVQQDKVATQQAAVSGVVSSVISEIRRDGDAAVRKYSGKFDKWTPTSFKLSQQQIDDAIAVCPPQVVKDIKEVQANVRKFAQAQRESIKDFEVEMQPGVFLGQRNNPISSVGA